MFQDYMLFPHKNVFKNVSFGLEMIKKNKDEINQRVSQVLALVGLPGFDYRDVSTLSGGEQQRVALARSLAPAPRLLMLDEPLGSLDRTLRERLLFELRDILQQSHQTALYVTHDQEEAFSLADRVVVMNHGRVAQIGSPEEIYQFPETEFLAQFLGFSNILDAKYRNRVLHTSIGDFSLEHQNTGQVKILIRPGSAFLNNQGSHKINGKIKECSFRGNICHIFVEIGNTTLKFEFPSASNLPSVGESIQLSFNPNEAIQVLK